MIDPNLPVDQQDIDDSDCNHLMDAFIITEAGQMICTVCKNTPLEEDQADFSGSTEGDR